MPYFPVVTECADELRRREGKSPLKKQRRVSWNNFAAMDIEEERESATKELIDLLVALETFHLGNRQLWKKARSVGSVHERVNACLNCTSLLGKALLVSLGKDGESMDFSIADEEDGECPFSKPFPEEEKKSDHIDDEKRNDDDRKPAAADFSVKKKRQPAAAATIEKKGNDILLEQHQPSTPTNDQGEIVLESTVAATVAAATAAGDQMLDGGSMHKGDADVNDEDRINSGLNKTYPPATVATPTSQTQQTLDRNLFTSRKRVHPSSKSSAIAITDDVTESPSDTCHSVDTPEKRRKTDQPESLKLSDQQTTKDTSRSCTGTKLAGVPKSTSSQKAHALFRRKKQQKVKRSETFPPTKMVILPPRHSVPQFTPLGEKQHKKDADLFAIVCSEADGPDGQPEVRLATCSGRNVWIYRQEACTSSQRSKLHLLGSFQDTDKLESFYTLVFAGRVQLRPCSSMLQQPWDDRKVKAIGKLPPDWESRLATSKGPQLVCVGGKQRVIQVLDPVRKQIIQTLSGHGDEIYDLQVPPTDKWLLLSASKDQSCRLWNLRTGSTVAVYGGHEGHRDAVVSVSWHSSGLQFASGGMDTRVMVWELTADVQTAIATSHHIADAFKASRGQQEECYMTGNLVQEQYPIFSSNKVHIHCVDCIHFIGDLLISKSTENMVKLWCPGTEPQTTLLGSPKMPPPSDVLLLRTFGLEHSDVVWYVRFAIDPSKQLLAAGNVKGVVYVWNIGARSTKPVKLNTRRQCTIRSLSFTQDGSVLVASTTDGYIFRWSVVDSFL